MVDETGRPGGVMRAGREWDTEAAIERSEGTGVSQEAIWPSSEVRLKRGWSSQIVHPTRILNFPVLSALPVAFALVKHLHYFVAMHRINPGGKSRRLHNAWYGIPDVFLRVGSCHSTRLQRKCLCDAVIVVGYNSYIVPVRSAT